MSYSSAAAAQNLVATPTAPTPPPPSATSSVVETAARRAVEAFSQHAPVPFIPAALATCEVPESRVVSLWQGLSNLGFTVNLEERADACRTAFALGDHATVDEYLRDEELCMEILRDASNRSSSHFSIEMAQYILSQDRPAFANNREEMNQIYSRALMNRDPVRLLVAFVQNETIRSRLVVDPRILDAEGDNRALENAFRQCMENHSMGEAMIDTFLRNPAVHTRLSLVPEYIPHIRRGRERLSEACQAAFTRGDLVTVNEYLREEELCMEILRDASYASSSRLSVELSEFILSQRNFGRAFQNAAENGHLRIMRWLIHNYGARITDGDFSMAFDNAALNGHQEIMQWLIRDHGTYITDSLFGRAFESAALNGHQGIMQWLIRDHRAHITDDRFGWALQNAAQNGHQGIVQWLLRDYEDRLTIDDFGRVFGIAALNGHQERMQWFIRHHSARLTSSAFGQAFENAALNGHQGIMQWLLRDYGNRITYDRFGAAFQKAARNGHLEIMRWLMQQHGARLTVAKIQEARTVANQYDQGAIVELIDRALAELY